MDILRTWKRGDQDLFISVNAASGRSISHLALRNSNVPYSYELVLLWGHVDTVQNVKQNIFLLMFPVLLSILSNYAMLAISNSSASKNR